jgi:Flp pilus assembly protein TadD
VDLKLTTDRDEQLRTLTEIMREDTRGETGWQRLGKLLLKLGQFGNAEELYYRLLEQTSHENEKAFYYNQLGNIKNNRSCWKRSKRKTSKR